MIFGIKQRGKESEKAYNVFFPLTYEENVKYDEITNEGELEATEL